LRNRIVMFDASGNAKREWSVAVGQKDGGSKLALWDGKLMVSNPDASTIVALDIASGVVSRLTLPDNGPLQLETPLGLAVGPDDNLYAVDSDARRVVVLSQAPSGP